MFPLTFSDIISTYDKLKRLAKKSLDIQDYEASLHYISTAANVAYNFNWRYTDSDFEEMLKLISERIITEKRAYVPVKGRMIFYDVFALDNRGLTQQYIRAMMNWGVELLFVLEGENLSQSTHIVEELKAYPRAKLITIDSGLSQVDKVVLLYNKIADFCPEKAFLHLHPASVVAVTLWNALPATTRYLVNLTDHAFWLGTKCIDYTLEFRDYGYTVSSQKRGLLPEQLLVQPFYPITDCQPFKGFPKEVTQESVVIFTGGAFYKMYGEGDVFFGIMAELLKQHPQVIILIAGSGDAGPIHKFIRKNKFQKQLILIGNRADITHVFDHCDIYLSTFPITGGLMSQLAAINGKPILAYTSPNIRCNEIEGLFSSDLKQDCNITHFSLESFFVEAARLIDDPEYRKSRGDALNKCVINPDGFSNSLWNIVQSNTNNDGIQTITIDYQKFSSLYLEIENRFIPAFKVLMIKDLKFKLFYLFPKVSIKCVFSINAVFGLFKKLAYKLKKFGLSLNT